MPQIKSATLLCWTREQWENEPRREHALSDGGIDRLGKITDGNTVGDSDAEDSSGRFSRYHWRRCMPNTITARSIFWTLRVYFDFAGEAAEALRVADGGIIVCSAKDGCDGGPREVVEVIWRI
jgi:elongation factor G